jgi:competence protein ComEA
MALRTPVVEPDAASVAARLDALRAPAPSRGWTPEQPHLMEPPGRTDGEPDAPTAGPEQVRLPEPESWSGHDPAERPSATMPTVRGLLRDAVEDRLSPGTRALLAAVSGRAVVMVVLVGLGVLVGGIELLHHREQGSTYPDSQSAMTGGEPASTDTGVTADDPSATASGSIVVDVGGRVRRPGLVTLPAGARVADALRAAGGALHHRDVAAVDLASKVVDGQLLLIGPAVTGSAASAAAAAPGAVAGSASTDGAPVDLNSATADQLDTLPGVGPVTAQKIIDWRSAHDGFTSVAQLQQVSGIGPARFAQLEDLVVA